MRVRAHGKSVKRWIVAHLSKTVPVGTKDFHEQNEQQSVGFTYTLTHSDRRVFLGAMPRPLYMSSAPPWIKLMQEGKLVYLLLLRPPITTVCF